MLIDLVNFIFFFGARKAIENRSNSVLESNGWSLFDPC